MSINNESTSDIVIYYRLSKSHTYDYLMVVLMLLSAILGSTIFGTLQIICEIILFILLIFGVLQVRLTKLDIILLSTFLIISLLSFIRNEFFSFALNFKIFGLCILTFVYFRKIHFYPGKLITMLHVLNFLLIVHQFVTGHFIVESAWFFGEYKEHANERPVGVFLIPHASAFFIAIYTIYLIRLKKKYFQGIFCFVLLLMISSLTSTVAFLAQISQQALNYIVNKFNFLRINIGRPIKLAVIVIPILLLSFYADDFIIFLKSKGGYTRYYSAEIMLNQLFDSRFFSDIFDFIPRKYDIFIAKQESGFADFGNEIGLVKIFVEGGFVLGLITLVALISRLKYYGVFIFVSLLHYSYVINMPFMLFLMMMYNHEIENQEVLKNSLKRQLKKENNVLLE